MMLRSARRKEREREGTMGERMEKTNYGPARPKNTPLCGGEVALSPDMRRGWQSVTVLLDMTSPARGWTPVP